MFFPSMLFMHSFLLDLFLIPPSLLTLSFFNFCWSVLDIRITTPSTVDLCASILFRNKEKGFVYLVTLVRSTLSMMFGWLYFYEKLN